MRPLEQRSIISGIGISRIGRRLGFPGLDLTEESSRAAIEDAGIAPVDIDAIATLGETPAAELKAALGIAAPEIETGIDHGGLLSPLMSACVAVSEGRARHVLVYRTVQMLGGAMVPPSEPVDPSRSTPLEPMRTVGPMAGASDLLANHAYSAANWLALHCQRHMHLYGTTKEQLGALAINSRANAALNPLAAYREPISMNDYLSARPVSDPFGLLDCDVPIDGSIAMVVSTVDHEAGCDHPVRVQAMGGATGRGGWYQRPDFPKMASVDAAQELWSRTDLKPADVDFAELYDGFTFLTLAWLEALGFCGEGESGPFVEDATRIALDGDLPLNTYGGQLSAGRMHGYWVVHEACLQLRGQAGDRQVVRHQLAAVAAGGGPIAGCLLLSR